MKKNEGYTYIEMLVSLAVASILVLTIGTLSSAGRRSYNKIVGEIGIYNDLTFGFKLMENRVRQAKSFKIESPSGEWQSDRLILNHKQAFGLYKETGKTHTDFVYMQDETQVTDRDVLFSISSADTISLTFITTGRSVIVYVSGEKEKVSFNLSTRIKRRS